MKSRNCCLNGSMLFEVTKEIFKKIGQVEYLYLCSNSIHFKSFQKFGS